MPVKRTSPAKNIVFWVAAGAVIILLWSLLQTPAIIKSEINFSQFMTDVEAKRIEEVTITGFQVRGQYKDGTTFKTVLPATYYIELQRAIVLRAARLSTQPMRKSIDES